MTWVERLNLAFQATGWTAVTLADRSGVPYHNVIKYLNGKVESPRGDQLKAIADALGVTVLWLREGIETPKMLVDESEPAPSISSELGAIGIASGSIPEIDLTAGMGGGGLTVEGIHSKNGISFSAEEVSDYWRLPDYILRRMHARQSAVAAFPVQGDSMDPTLREGDIIFVDTRHRAPSPDGVYALLDDFGGVIVKRLEAFRDDEGTRVRVISDNDRHAVREYPADQVHVIGRYIGRFTV